MHINTPEEEKDLRKKYAFRDFLKSRKDNGIEVKFTTKEQMFSTNPIVGDIISFNEKYVYLFHPSEVFPQSGIICRIDLQEISKYE